MKSLLLLGLAAACSLVLACSGGDAALGEECGASGADGECAEGGICGKADEADTLQCLKVCTEQTDCAADEECNGVEGASTKGCRPKDGK